MNNIIFFITTPKFKKILHKENFFLIFILCNLFFGFSLHAASLDMFFENLMIRECGIYTLLGSKPMTQFDVTSKCDETEEELVKSYENLVEFFEKAKTNPKRYNTNGLKLPNFEEFKNKCIANEEKYQFLDSRKLWQTWLESNIKISSLNYKIVHRKSDPNIGLFINVPQSIYILKKYYNEFHQLTYLHFDISTILNSIEDPNSTFWNRVFKNHFLFGLLMGFGEKNSYLFNWFSNHSISCLTAAISRFPELSRNEAHTRAVLKKEVIINDLSIPIFQSFDINDPQIEIYKNEREKIIDFLKDKNLTTFVLHCLTAEN